MALNIDDDFSMEDFDIEEDDGGSHPAPVELIDDETEEETAEVEDTEEVELEDKVEDTPKNSKKAKGDKGKTKKEEVSVIPIKDKKPLNLYIVTDRKIPNLLTYLRERGLAVSNIFESINEAKDMLILQGENCRLVIMETGSGRFTGTSTRKEIVDIIGLSDENTQVSVFYTDSIVKSETIRVIDKKVKRIDWIKYTTTLDMAVRLLAYEENYVLGDGYDEDERTDAKKILGLRLEKAKLDPKWDKAGTANLGMSSKDIEENVIDATEHLLQTYEIRV